MANLKKQILKNLDGASRIAIVGVGSEIRGDDAAGMSAARTISAALTRIQKKKVRVFFGDTAPENITGEIRTFQPDHLIIIDAADMNLAPGKISFIQPLEITGPSFSGHQMPVKVFADFIKTTMNCEVMIIGIQPKQTEIGTLLSRPVQKGADQVAEIVMDVITEVFGICQKK